MPFDSTPIPTKKTETLHILERAARLLVEGWIQEEFENDDGYCLVGAVRASAELQSSVKASTNEEKVNTYIVAAISEEWVGYEPDSDGIIEFNDDPDRTHEDILEVMDRAISLAEEKEHG